MMIAVIVAGFVAASVGYFGAYEFNEFMAYFFAANAEKKAAVGDREGALADCERALKWMPNKPSLYEDLAGVRAEVGDVGGALAYLDKLLELNPSFQWGYMHRAGLYERLGQPEQAEEQRQLALRWLNDDTAADALNERAYKLARQDRLLDEALADVQLALQLTDTVSQPKAYLMYVDTRAWVYYRQNKLELALVDADAAVAALEPARQQVDAKKQEQLEAARLQAERVSDETDRNARMKLLQDDAERRWKVRCLELDRHHAVILEHRSRIHEALGNLPQAASDLRRAHQLGYDRKSDYPEAR